jgi:hypothetical protein
MHIVYITLTAVGGLALLLLSPLIVDFVNLFRPKGRELYSTEEIPDAYDLRILRIFSCEACQACWATLIAVWVSGDPSLRLFLACYAPVLVAWLGVKAAYRKLH